MSWFNLNDSINNIKGQISNFASEVLADDVDNKDLEEAQSKIRELTEICTAQQKQIQELQTANSNLEKRQFLEVQPENDPTLISELKQRITSLEETKKDLENALSQLDTDCQQTVEKLLGLKDALQCKYEEMEKKYSSLEDVELELRKEIEEKTKAITALEAENERLKLSEKKDDDEAANEKFKLIEDLKKEIEDLDIQNEALKSEIISKSETIEQLRQIQMKSQSLSEEMEIMKEKQKEDKQRTHETYVKIISQSMEKYMNSNGSHFPASSDDPLIEEFTDQIGKVMQLLLDFRQKTEMLEKELFAAKEKITEKNYEIGKLLQNSEMLSQEVINKSQAIKDYVNENSELMKNNDLLINELDTLKRNPGLQTISESNEDSLVLLESQLEKANKRIKELEMLLAEREPAKNNFDTNIELEYFKKQLNISGVELNQCQSEYYNLLEKYNELAKELAALKKDNLDLKESNEKLETDKQNLKVCVEKLTSEAENNEYQYSELQAKFDSIREDCEEHKKKCRDVTKDEITVENNVSELKSQVEGLQNTLTETRDKFSELQNLFQTEQDKSETIVSEVKSENIILQQSVNDLERKLLLTEKELKDMKEKCNFERHLVEKLEEQLTNVEEKLQSAKMSETSLKWQIDTLHKEINSLNETKNSLNEQLQDCENEITTKEYEVQQISDKFDALWVCNEEQATKYVEVEQNLRKSEEKLAEYERTVANLKQSETRCKELERMLKLNAKEAAKQKSLVEQLHASEKRRGELEEILRRFNQERHREGIFEEELVNKQLAMVNLAENEREQQRKEKEEYERIITELKAENRKLKELEGQIQELTISRNELVGIVTVKHQENVTYHNEIQRLTQIITATTESTQKLQIELEAKISRISDLESQVDKLSDQNGFLREKCERLAQNLLEEQSNAQKALVERSSVSEREQSLAKELERLRAHLVEIEDMYTQELLEAEKRNKNMEAKMSEIEEREKNSSTMYTSVSIRANQQVEALQGQIQQLTSQREELRRKLSDAEDEIGRSSAALRNLQFVLEQFQRDKEKDVQLETERLRRQVKAEQQIQQELKSELSALKDQLEDSRNALKAASRLSDQLEFSKQQVTTLKEEAKKLQEKLTKAEEKYTALTTQTDAKIDKTLIKNLVLGFTSTCSNYTKDQQQILKIIATVLDFNQQELDKAHLNKTQQSSWLQSLLHPQVEGPEQQSLSEAFVRFLEQESRPRVLPNLLGSTEGRVEAKRPSVSLSEIVLPTFSDFGHSRNSSSILKDVLKDNT